MRTLLFTLALLLSVNVFAVNPTIAIKSAENINGTLEVYFYFRNNDAYFTPSDSIYFYTIATDGTGNYSLIHKMAVSDTLGMEHDGLFYKLEYQIPSSFHSAPMKINGSTKLACCGTGSIIQFQYNLVIEDIITSTVNPVEEKEEIIYYNMQGIKIEKPSEGFYLWKSEKGSGKIYSTY
jgi:hypothetical protein